MTETAATKLRRMLALIPEFADDEEHSLDEVAGRLGVERRTLVKDLRDLVERWDDPGGFTAGVQVYLTKDGVSLFTDHFSRPMRITVPELGALELGLALLRAERPAEDHAPIDRARVRLREVLATLPGEPEPTFDHRLAADAGSETDRVTLTRLRQAMRHHRKVRLTYRGSDDDHSSERVVCPYVSAFATGAWYLVAHCERSNGIRVFRVDRIEAIEPLEDSYEVPDDFSADEIVKGGRVFQGDAEEQVQVRYGTAVARWIAEREGRELDADGTLTLDYPLADPKWVVRHVLQYGADAEVLGPPSAREAVREALERMLAP